MIQKFQLLKENLQRLGFNFFIPYLILFFVFIVICYFNFVNIFFSVSNMVNYIIKYLILILVWTPISISLLMLNRNITEIKRHYKLPINLPISSSESNKKDYLIFFLILLVIKFHLFVSYVFKECSDSGLECKFLDDKIFVPIKFAFGSTLLTFISYFIINFILSKFNIVVIGYLKQFIFLICAGIGSVFYVLSLSYIKSQFP